MKNRKRIFIGFISILTLALMSVYGITGSGKNTMVYIVKQGDTLWNISVRFNANPWLWPKLWEQNKYITNPHLIYPGEPIALLPTSVLPVTGIAMAKALPITTGAKALPTATEAQIPANIAKLRAQGITTPAIEIRKQSLEQPGQGAFAAIETAVPYGVQYAKAPPNTYIYSLIGSAGFITKHALVAAGEIVAAANAHREIFGEHDTVFINLGSDSGIKNGDQFNIYKTGSKIYDPTTGAFLGYKIKILGRLKVTKVQNNLSTAKIVESYEEIGIHDKLIPFEPGIKTINLVLASNPLGGYIIYGSYNRHEYGENDIVYINKGSSNGVQVGNTFVIYKNRKPVKNPATGGMLNLPKEILGKLLIIKVQSSTSTAIITKSIKEIAVGNKVLADTASGII